MPYFLSTQFGQQLRAARRDRHLSQTDLAQKAGLHRNLVSRMERGENVGIDEIHKAAQALGFRLGLEESIRPTWENATAMFGDEDDTSS